MATAALLLVSSFFQLCSPSWAQPEDSRVAAALKELASPRALEQKAPEPPPIGATRTGAAAGIENWRERTLPALAFEDQGDDLFTRLYGHGQGAWHVLPGLERIGAERFLGEIALDPPVMSRLLQFLDFFKGRAVPGTYAEARAAFSRHLGEVVVYRGIALLPQEVEGILREGLRSKARRLPEDLRSPLPVIWQEHLLRNGGGQPDPFISVTSRPDIAAGVAAKYAVDGRSVYVLSMRLPLLDMLQPREKAGFITFYPWLPEHCFIRVRFRDGHSEVYPFDADVESLVLYRIFPKEIVSIEKIDAPPVDTSVD